MFQSTTLAGFNKTIINIRAINVMRKILDYSIHPELVMTQCLTRSRATRIIESTLDNMATAQDCNEDEKAYITLKLNMARMMIARGMFESAFNFLWEIVMKLHIGELMMNDRLLAYGVYNTSGSTKDLEKLGVLSTLPNDVLENIKDMVEASFLNNTLSSLYL